VTLLLLILGIAIILVGIAILDRCNKMYHSVEWLQRRFMAESPQIIINRSPNLALEFFTIKEKLAPLFFMPLAPIAVEIKQMYENVNKRFEETLEVLRARERKEIEAFAATVPPEGKSFPPSDDLRKSLRAWAVERHKADIIEKWTHLFTETYVGLLSGKISLGEAEKKLKNVNPLVLNIRDHSAEAKIFHSWASNWEAGRWKNRLSHLREIERWKKSSG